MLISHILLTIAIFIVISFYAKNIAIDGVGSDARKQINGAAHFRDWGGWPSGMHNYTDGKARMKDVGVLLLVMMQRILRDNKGFYPALMVSNFAHLISSILLFLIAANYWNEQTASILFLFYVFSIWPYIIVLHAGLQTVAQMFFLLSIYSLQQTNINISSSDFVWFAISGLFFMLMNFSSASGRKYIPVLFFALIYHSNGNNFLPWILNDYDYTAYYSGIFLFVISSFCLLIYHRRIRDYLLDTISNIVFTSEEKKEWSGKLLKLFINIPRLILGTLLILLAYLFEDIMYVSVIVFVLSSIFTLLLLLAPNLAKNMRGYYAYWIIESDWGSHYPLYEKYFMSNYGKIFNKGEEGWLWYLKFGFRMIPFVTFLFIVAIAWLFYAILGSDIDNALTIGVTLLLVSLLPLIMSEVTKGPKASLPMFTGFVPLYLFLGYWIYINISGPYSDVYNYIIYCILIIHVLWNIYQFITDIFPARNTIHSIVKTLDSFNIREFNTYNTLFNDPFVDVIKNEYPDKYRINYISSLEDVEDGGYVFIPCTNSKASYFQSFKDIGPVGNFVSDQKLNKLIDSKMIEDYSLSKIKTLGTSKFWQHLGNVVSFRDLILNEVRNQDKYRGYCWIIKVKN